MIINQHLTVAGGGPTDPYFANVVLLCHFDGTNGSTTYTNSCSRGNTPANIGTGTCALSTAQKVYGTASLLTVDTPSFPTNDAVHCGNDNDYDFGTGDFTIEFRIRPVTLATKNIFDMRPGSDGVYPVMYVYSDGKIAYYVNSTEVIVSSVGAIAQNTWAAVAYSRVSGTGRLFVDGTQVGSNYSDSNNYTPGPSNEIWLPSYVSPIAAYYDELRITQGTGRYSGTYTPDAQAFPDS